jgi:hypothetical protein
VNKDRPREVSLIVADKAKTFRDRLRDERESACQASISNGATAAESMMELHVEMPSADRDIDVYEPMGAAGSNSGHSRYGPWRVS